MMLRDSDIDSLNNHLATLSQENEKHHENLQAVLKQFRDLLDDYSSLKSDYEEVKEGREKYKRQARGQERNPFVLVLVDGDGYLFKEHFIKAGSDGGINAAGELSETVRELMHTTMGAEADRCRIMVRVYANILGLSKVLARNGMVGHEARSLSPFVSAFNRAQDLFDFVDAAEKKEGSDYKIREMFRLYADMNQCRHIYFAGCHDTGYGSLLTPYRGKGDRITLLKGAGFHREFEELGLPIRELPSVFMSTPLTSNKTVPSVNTKLANFPTNGSNGTNGATGTVPTKPICKHFQKEPPLNPTFFACYSIDTSQGICRFGNNCIKQHVMPNQQLPKPGDESPKQLWSAPHTVGRSQEFLSTELPPNNGKSNEYIPVNESGERLDTYCPQPSSDALDEYHRRAKSAKVCNSYHLSGECGDMSCPYDHSEVSDEIVEVLRYIVLQHPCSKAGACRSIKCYLGHLCQKPNCKGVKSWQCRFNHRAHTLDLKVAQWVVPVDTEYADFDRSCTSDDSNDGGQSLGEPTSPSIIEL
ncbi:Zinc finger CCCH-type [Penicillium argentinense]|uniref:Zinc finger CCCH-type n=1 Tax=Penicillium argentinense TaxID=1131581 RepID=A0A9W9EI90_9EURO|nr:Zinc finger CCCH-type [Penicillium argentinense]KAJ5082237.1 Zinc finger CCCH-type [Penicillium argentinense]